MSQNSEKASLAAIERVEMIKAWPDPKIRYRDVRPISDIKDMFESSVRIFGNSILFYVKDATSGPYRGISYNQTKADVDALGTALIAMGLKDKKIAIIGDNRYEWAVSYLATVCGAGIVVPLDKELPQKELNYLIKDAEVECIIFSHKYEKAFIESQQSGENSLKILISMDAEEDNDQRMSFNKVIADGRLLLSNGDRAFIDAEIDREKMSILLFTSGTTGMAKGVMLSHANIAENLMVMGTLVNIRPEDIFFSVLPIHHTYECTCGFLLPIYRGAGIAFCEGLKYIIRNLEEARPTVFLGVPLIFESIYKKIWSQAKKSKSDVKLRKVLAINEKTKKIGIDLAPILLKKVTAIFGGRMRLMIAGGAAIDPDVLKGLKAFGINAIQGYGLTECSPIVGINPDFDSRDNSAGYPPPFIDVRIVEANEEGLGEIIVKGRNIMLGYYHNEEATNAVIKDGWFYTGDLGFIDKEGYIHITGRKKNVIITKNGKNVFPEELEFYLGKIPYIDESMVWGMDSEDNGDTLICASIKTNQEEIAMILGDDYTEEQASRLIWKELDKLNDDLPYYKRIKKADIRKEEFEKTTGKKIKRFSEANRRV
jgi:long-subunit acyl-CoA synthetase (AMP-forming)